MRLPIVFILITVLLDSMGIGLIIPVMPDLLQEVEGAGLSSAAIWGGILATSFAVMQFVFGPLIGNLSDRFGRRPVLLLSLVVMAADYLVMAVAGSIWMLLAGRLVGGITAATQSTANAYMADISAPQDKAANFGLVGAAFGMGFVFGPPLGAVIAGTLGTAAVGFCVAALCALNFVSAFLFLRETRDPRAAKTDTEGGGIFASLREVPAIRRLFSVMFLFTLGFSVMPVIGALIFADRFGLTAVQIGYVFTLIGVATAAVQAAIGPLAKALGIASLPFVPVDLFLWIGLPALVIYAFGHAFVYPTLTALVAAETDEARQGTVLGQLQAAGSLALVVGPIAAGFLYDASMSAPFVITGMVLVIAVVIAYSHPRNRIETP